MSTVFSTHIPSDTELELWQPRLVLVHAVNCEGLDSNASSNTGYASQTLHLLAAITRHDYQLAELRNTSMEYCTMNNTDDVHKKEFGKNLSGIQCIPREELEKRVENEQLDVQY